MDEQPILKPKNETFPRGCGFALIFVLLGGWNILATIVFLAIAVAIDYGPF